MDRDWLRPVREVAPPEREENPEPLFRPVSEWEGRPVPPREWLVADMIPAHTVTMLGGDGGTGKSLLAQQLAAATALGRAWIGRPVARPGTALYLSAEDDEDELQRRWADVARAEGVTLGDMDRLHRKSLADGEALLAALDRKTNALVPTPLYHRIDREMREARPALLVLDTLADLHSGEENSRGHARQFVGLLRRLAIRHRCAVLLLAHPSLTGMSSGSGLSGSTAWNGSVRSRLYFERVVDEGYEADANARRLTRKKSNYGPTSGEILVRWTNGVFLAETGMDRLAGNAKAERVFLSLLDQFNAEGRRVRHTTGDGYAPHTFAKSGRAEGLGKAALRTAMEALFAKRAIFVAEEGPPSRRVRYLERAAK